MGKSILLLRLEGPLQSWGTRSRWDVRDTATEPTKSGLIGLLGCALGYRMYDPRLEKLDESLRFGVRVENPGRVLMDFQTITDFLPAADGGYKIKGGTQTVAGPPAKLRAERKEPPTILSPHAYLEDAAFLAAFEQADSGRSLLAECARALQRPRWPLFLGRKACVPTRPVYEAMTETYEDLGDALHHYPWSWLGSRATLRVAQGGHLLAFVEVSDQTPGPDIGQRQDTIRTNPARVYGFRTVKRLIVDFPDS